MTVSVFNPADIIFLIIVGFFALIGWKNGFLKTGFKLFSFVAAIVIACLLYPVLTEYLKNTSIYDKIYIWVADYLPKATVTAPAFLPKGMQMAIQQGGENALNMAAEYFTILLLNVLAFILVVVGTKIALIIIEKLLKIFSELPVIGLLNRIAGAILGGAEGFLIVCIILVAIYAVPSLGGNENIGGAVQNSVISKAVYEENPVLKFLMPKEDEEVPTDEQNA